jgi:hypothetical protein
MDEADRAMHLAAGEYYGQQSTCGKKQNYKTEVAAGIAAVKMRNKTGHNLEEYPCFWCEGWHIGRTLSEKERTRFSVSEVR